MTASVDPSSGHVRGVQQSVVRHHSLWKLRTEILPSLEAQARIGPRSYGAQAIELTEV